MKRILIFAVMSVLLGCAAQSPVLYPNEHLKNVEKSRLKVILKSVHTWRRLMSRLIRGQKWWAV